MTLLLPRGALRLIPAPDTRTKRKAGALQNALLKLWSLPATVVDVHELAERFRLITLEGEALKKVQWHPGQKIQVRLGGFVTRTYTPILWDTAAGVTQILSYLHYHLAPTSPGARWAATADVGDACALTAPRESLDLFVQPRPTVLFGDETSIGLARAFKTTPGGFGGIAFVLEISAPSETRKVLEALRMPEVALVARTRDDAHLTQVEALLLQEINASPERHFLLTGQARSIQRLTRFLHSHKVAPSRIHSRAYWSVGKTGLD